MALKEAFPHLCGIAYTKDAHLKLSGGSNQWNVSFARAIHDWVVDVFPLFFRVKSM